MKTYKYGLLHIGIILFSCLMFSSPLHAGVAPEILRLDTVMQENEVRITVVWISEVPVVKIIASGGKSTQEIESTETDPIINKRTPQGGYAGSKTFVLQSKNVAVVKSYKSEQYSSNYVRQGNTSIANTQAIKSTEPFQEVIVVTLQLVDKYANESAQIRRDVPTTVELAAQPAAPVTSAELNLTPTENTTTQQTQIAQNPQDAALTAGINAANQIIVAPTTSITNAQAANEKIVVTASATASKPIQQFTFEITDTQNNSTVFSGTFDCSNGLECKERRGESGALQPGNYTVLIRVRDGDGRESTATSNVIAIAAANPGK